MKVAFLQGLRIISYFTEISVMEFNEVQRIYSGWNLVGGWLAHRWPGLAVPVVGALVGFNSFIF